MGAQGAANTGAQGAQGHQGAANTGAQGNPGAQGNNGAQGAQGHQGASGSSSLGSSANQVVYKNSSNNAAGSNNLTFDGNKLKLPSTSVTDNNDGTFSLTGPHIQLGTNASNCLQLGHSDNGLSFISEVGDSDLSIITNGTNLYLQKDATAGYAEDMIHCIANGAVKLFYDGGTLPKFETTSLGSMNRGSLSIGAGHPTSNFSSQADDLVVANFAQDTGISIMSGTSNAATVAFGSTTFGTGAIQARLFYDSGDDIFVMTTNTTGHDIAIKSAGEIRLGDLNNPTIIVEDMTAGGSNYGVEVDGTIYPKASGAHPYKDLGLSGIRWNNIYGNYLHGNGAGITNLPTTAAKSTFAHTYGDTSYSGSSYQNGYPSHISCSLTPSNSNNRVVVMATFQLKRNGSQNNNAYARAKLTGGGDLRNIEIVRTNQISYQDAPSNHFKLIAYDAAGNTSSRTYNLAVNYTSASGSSGVSIRNASIVAIELRS